MITSKAVIRTSKIKQSVSITIKTSKFKITGIKTNYMHTSGRKTYIGITPIIDLKSTPDDNELNFREFSVNLDMTVTNDLTLILNSNNNVKSIIADISYEVSNVNNKNILLINAIIDNEEIHHSSNIIQNDDVLRYYRKIFPVYRLKTYQVHGNQISNAGEISKITYDKEIGKFRVYLSDGAILLYNNYPLVYEEDMVIQNREHITPPNLYWLIDDSYPDLIFVNQFKVFESKITLGYDNWNSVNDLIYALNRYSSNGSFSDDFAILSAKFKIQALNQEIKIDFQNKHFKVQDFLQEIGPGAVKLFPFPFRRLYSKLSAYNAIQITIDLFDIKKYLESHSLEDLENFTMQPNLRLEMSGEIRSDNIIPHSRKSDDEELYRISKPNQNP